MSIKEEFIKKIEIKQLKVGVAGLGYVGLPLAADKAISGFNATEFDISYELLFLYGGK